MENKYYVPDISEFYVGFEYEYYSRTHGVDDNPYWDWSKEIHDVGDHIGMDGEFYLPDLIEDKEVRVKYLDKEDIEDVLGVKPKIGGCYWFEKDTGYFRPDWITGDHFSKIRLQFHPKDTWVSISFYNPIAKVLGNEELEWEKFFEGSVKNKSELIKLLKMIGVE